MLKTYFSRHRRKIWGLAFIVVLLPAILWLGG
ncbi:hypothetical protein, partial [Yersinia enterocolitica]